LIDGIAADGAPLPPMAGTSRLELGMSGAFQPFDGAPTNR
jgi:hypothetical protein